jgi:hypothetical protein
MASPYAPYLSTVVVDCRATLAMTVVGLEASLRTSLAKPTHE